MPHTTADPLAPNSAEKIQQEVRFLSYHLCHTVPTAWALVLGQLEIPRGKALIRLQVRAFRHQDKTHE